MAQTLILMTSSTVLTPNSSSVPFLTSLRWKVIFNYSARVGSANVAAARNAPESECCDEFGLRVCVGKRYLIIMRGLAPPTSQLREMRQTASVVTNLVAFSVSPIPPVPSVMGRAANKA